MLQQSKLSVRPKVDRSLLGERAISQDGGFIIKLDGNGSKSTIKLSQPTLPSHACDFFF